MRPRLPACLPFQMEGENILLNLTRSHGMTRVPRTLDDVFEDFLNNELYCKCARLSMCGVRYIHTCVCVCT